MQKLMGTGDLLDANGHLVERGWATQEVRRYERAAVGVPHDDPAIKEWDYYAILTPDFGLALTVADNGHMGFLGASWMDFKAGTFVNGGAGPCTCHPPPTPATSSTSTQRCRSPSASSRAAGA